MEFHAVRYQDDAAGADERSLPYQPALDGLRALAVTAVLAYHAGLTWARGGFLGVDAFFVLSGYLITSLLIVEWRNTGTIDLPAFWARRARRLLPALFLLLAGIAGYALVFAEPAELDKLRNDALATLGYIANWHLAFSGASYFDQFSLPSPLRHTWSLAIEEQWYLIWPLLFVLLLRLGRSSLAVLFTASLVMIAGSALLMAWLYDPGADPSRVYYGTDTRAQSLLVGAVLAMLLAWHGPLRASAARLLLQLTALAGAIFTGWLWVSASDDSTLLYRGGLLVSAVAIAVVIAAVVQPQRGPLGRLLSLSPLRGLGRISYGVYLWHWPVYLVLTPVRTGWHGYGLLTVQVAVTLALAIASYYVIENPVRRGALRSWRAWTVAPTAAAVLVIALVMVTRGGTQPFAFLDEAEARAAVPTAAMPVAAFDVDETPPPVSPKATPTRAPAPTAEAHVLAATSDAEPAGGAEPVVLPAETPTPAPTAAVAAPARVLFVGDSVAWSMTGGLYAQQEELDFVFHDATTIGCGMARGAVVIDGNIQPIDTECESWPLLWLAEVLDFQPDVVMLMISFWHIRDREVDGRILEFGTPEADAYLLSELQIAIDLLSSNGATVALITAPYFKMPGWTLDGEEYQSAAEDIDRLNVLYREATRRNPGRTTLIELNRFLSPEGAYPHTLDGVHMLADGVHFGQEGSAFVGRWLAPRILELAQGESYTTRAN
ncbi:MAG: acyltransferase [Chloroflexi bacterium]|nr:acyltransferase [Chloroflexota bacterium]